jgi:hypothetical protein
MSEHGLTPGAAQHHLIVKLWPCCEGLIDLWLEY